MPVANFVEKYWKVLMWLTVAFLVLSIAVLLNNVLATGSFIKRDVDLVGGKVITIEVTDADVGAVRAALPDANVRIVSGATRTLIIEMPFEADENAALQKLGDAVDFVGEPSIRIVGPVLGDIFFQQAQIAMLAAFLLMALTVFLLFRSVVPSSIVLLAAATDIIGTIAVLSVIGVPLSLPVIGALLALIGYSVGTDILLTAELLKSGRSTYEQSVFRAAKTGITLTFTALVALTAMLLISGSAVIAQIATVMLIGLVIDMPATWLTNAGVFRLWLNRRKVHQ